MNSLRLWLFSVYLALYLGFMLLTAFDLGLMASRPFGGVNLAILYGFALIVVALAMAVAYWRLARGSETTGSQGGGGR